MERYIYREAERQIDREIERGRRTFIRHCPQHCPEVHNRAGGGVVAAAVACVCPEILTPVSTGRTERERESWRRRKRWFLEREEEEMVLT